MWQPTVMGNSRFAPAEEEIRVSLRPVGDWDELARQWRELEQHSDCSFFQSWTYTGCLARERFPAPMLLEAHANGRVVALGLFNHRGARLGSECLLLGESGIPSFDTVFIEHNGPLIARGYAPLLLPLLLDAALKEPIAPTGRRPGGRMVLMSGVDDALLAVARASGAVKEFRQSRLAPVVDLATLRHKGIGLLDGVSSNTRYQLRRSQRRFANAGALSVRRARCAEEGHHWLEALADLHQQTWQARGWPGAFADASFRRFHHALIDRGLPLGQVDVLEISAGARRLGYLLNFVFHGTVYAYQSGFDYAVEHRHEKPGLTCHHQAIDMYVSEGLRQYDFLGGAERYKMSLASAATALHWVLLAPRWSPAGLLFRFKQSWDAIAVGRGGRIPQRAQGRPVGPDRAQRSGNLLKGAKRLLPADPLGSLVQGNLRIDKFHPRALGWTVADGGGNSLPRAQKQQTAGARSRPGRNI